MLESLNQHLFETEKLSEIVINPQTINYQDFLLQTYKMIEDPFERELQELGYERMLSNDN